MKDITDQEILDAFEGDPLWPTWQLAALFKVKTSHMLRRLKKMESDSRLGRSETYSGINNIVWVKK